MTSRPGSRGNKSQGALKSGPREAAAAAPPPPPQRQTTRRQQRRCGSCMVVLVVLFACCLAFLRFGESPFGPAPDPQIAEWATEQFQYDEPLDEGSGREPHETDRYLVGVGKADITGPVVEINLMGYADSKQIGSGLRQRLYSRAFIVADIDNPRDRFVYLVLDVQSGDTAVRYGILHGLRQLGAAYSMYGHDNLAVTATHSHSGPGAWLNYLLPQITSKGFDKQSYRAIVDGCLLSIKRAHDSLSPGFLSVGTTKVYGANINRSLFSYLENPESERAKYNVSKDDDGSVEKDMTLLKFQRESDGKNIGVLTWFPTHGTSMTVKNTLITGDNKGLAADLFEKKVRGGSHEAEDFVAGFSQANMGDASPNTLGAWCNDGSGELCDFKTSACRDGVSSSCRGRGPKYGKNDQGASSCFDIAQKQVDGALRIYESLNEQQHNVRGIGVKAIHEFHDMAHFEFSLPNSTVVRTCPAALGYNFAGGTSDEPGHFDIVQHASNDKNSSFLWRIVRWVFKSPSDVQKECQYPKTILLDVGEVSRPYQWTPNVVDIQTFRVGQLIIIVSPGEATTMAGRRWKEAVAARSATLLAGDLGGQEPIVVIGAPSNSYTHYITTAEEYGVQRYEGASTLYGPNTLAAYVNRTVETLHFLAGANPTPRGTRRAGPRPPDNSRRSLSFIAGVLYDRIPRGQAFGDVKSDVSKQAFKRGEIAWASFVGANPRNNLRLEGTFAAVEHRVSGDNKWSLVRDDSDWELIFRWKRTSALSGTSEVVVEWHIEEWTPPGEYRLRYFGDARSMGGKITPFEGTSRVFQVTW